MPAKAVARASFILDAEASCHRLARELAEDRWRRMRRLQALYEVGAIDAEEVAAKVCAWQAHARHGHTRSLCDRVLGELVFRRAGDSG